MLKKPLLLAMIAAASLGAVIFPSQASAHDPLAGALIGGGIGAAVAGPPGAAVGAILGTIAGSADSHHHFVEPGYVDRGYYAPEPAAYPPAPAYYQPAPTYYAPGYYEPAPAYRVYRAPPVYYSGHRHWQRVRDHDGYRERPGEWRDRSRSRHRNNWRDREGGDWRRY